MNNLNRQPATQQYLNWNNVRKDIDKNTIDENNFESVKKRTLINKQMGRSTEYLESVKKSIEIGIEDSKMHEYSVLKGIDELDWFEEQARGRQEIPITAMLASEYDDTCNHVDVVCSPRSMKTGRIIPFGIDATYSIGGDDRMLDKIDWTSNDKNHFHGAARVDYYQVKGINGRRDAFKGDPILMPRFVVGYDFKLADSIIKTAKIDKNLMDYYSDDNEIIENNEDILNAKKAKWCVLRELEHQANMMKEYLEPKMEHNDDAKKLYRYVNFLSIYFDKAIKTAEKNDPESAQNYVNDDPVYQNIMSLRYTK